MEFFQRILFYSRESPILFTQLYFWGFLAFSLFVYSFFYKKMTLRNTYLFIISLFFYYKTSGVFVILLIFTILISYYLAILLYRSKDKKKRIVYITLGIVFNLSLLAYYKYTYFLVNIINSLFDTHLTIVDVLGVMSNFLFDTGFDVSKIILPAGISFFIFHAISYMVDVYRDKLEPVKSIADYGFYVSFFPQLVAGPIIRASEFIPQTYRPYNLSKFEFGHAIMLILNGMIKKMIFADYLSINFVDRVFTDPSLYSGFENLMALFGYSLQVYCDFSGYTDIAMGVALLFGFKIPTNFNSPYKALNVGDFWKRWHISLSSWLKDYLYIPLGGNRGGKLRTEMNLMLTMLLGGLWHGADLKFVIWGGLNGLGIVIYKYWRKISPYENNKWMVTRVWKIFLTFSFITFTRIFFRASNMDIVGAIFRQLGKGIDLSLALDVMFSYRKIFLVMIAGYILHWLPARIKEYYRGVFIRTPVVLKIIVCVLVVVIIYQAHTSILQPFIYFQF